MTDSSVDLLGKNCEDLQSSIAIANGEITGTLNYVTGYTGFSSKTKEQKGNFIALHIENESADEIYAGISPSESGKELVKLDPDGIIIIRVADHEAQEIRVEVVKNGVHDGFDLSLANLTCTPQA